MRRSVIWSCLLNLEPVEFGKMPNYAGQNKDGAVTAVACEEIPASHPDQYKAVEAWLAPIQAKFGPEPGWLNRYALTLISVPDPIPGEPDVSANHTPSPEHAVTFTEGSADTLNEFLLRVQHTIVGAQEAEDYEDLAHKRAVVIVQMWDLLSCLGRLITSNAYDGDIRISPDGPNMLFFVHPKTGYHGGFMMDENQDPAKARFRIAT